MDFNGDNEREFRQPADEYNLFKAYEDIAKLVEQLDVQTAYADGLQTQIDDLQEVIDGHHRLVRKLDVACFGLAAAEQASLCDLVLAIPTLIAQASARANALEIELDEQKQKTANASSNYLVVLQDQLAAEERAETLSTALSESMKLERKLNQHIADLTAKVNELQSAINILLSEMCQSP